MNIRNFIINKKMPSDLLESFRFIAYYSMYS